MKKIFIAVLALGLTLSLSSFTSVKAVEAGFQNDSYASQIFTNAFSGAVKHRLELARLPGTAGGRVALAPLSSTDAYGAVVNSAYASRGGRQLDCVYYNGFTVWGDLYGAWSRQRDKGGNPGYKYRVGGPAVGFDWSNGTFTAGVATTYAWGKIKGRYEANDRKTRSWGLTGYGQWNGQQFYANAQIGYGYNRFRDSDRIDNWGAWDADNYRSNSWNVAGEFGYKLKLSYFSIVPNIGLRYFNDDRKGTDEARVSAGPIGYPVTASWSGRKYHVLELPVGVDVGYEILTGIATIRPHVGFTWTPELERRHGKASVLFANSGGATYTDSVSSPRRGRNGYAVSGGLQANFSQSISASLEYKVEFRDRNYEQGLNLGVGFTF